MDFTILSILIKTYASSERNSITSKGASIQALKDVLHSVKKYIAQTQLFNLHNSILQMYNPEATESDDGHDNITKVRDLLNWADAFVLCAPDYHGSISGILKDFLENTSTICLKNLWLSLRIL